MSIIVYHELKNLIIGGDFNINPWQRGTSFVSPATTDYLADRFQIRKSGVQEFTITKDTDSPTHSKSGLFNTESMNINVTTPNAAPGIGDFTTLEQPIEGYMAMAVYNNVSSISFWAYSDVAGTYCVAFQNGARARNYIIEYTITTPATWERFEFFIIHDASVGTWEINQNTGFRVIFTLNAGVNLQGSPGTWQAGDLIATSNQVNFAASGGNDFRLALIRFTKDSATDSYWLRDRMTQVALCQRYYQKSYNMADMPGTLTSSGIAGTTTAGTGVNLTDLSSDIRTNMRATPTTTWYSPVSGVINNIANITDAVDVAISSTTGEGESNTGYPVSTLAVANNKILEAHYTLDSEL